MKKSVLVVGVGRFGRGVIESLYELGHDVFAIDNSEDALDNVRDKIVSGALIDIAVNDDELIQIVGKKNFDVAVIAMGTDFEAALLTAHIVKEAGILTYAKVASERRGHILTKMGVDQVVLPERDSGRRLAHFINNTAAVDIMDLPQGFMIEQMTVGEGFDNQIIRDLGTNKRLGVWILLVYHQDVPQIPQASTKLCRGDTIVVFGKKNDVRKLELENSKK